MKKDDKMLRRSIVLIVLLVLILATPSFAIDQVNNSQDFKRIIVSYDNVSGISSMASRSDEINYVSSEFQGNVVYDFPKFSASVVNVSSENYESLVNQLIEEGFNVRDEHKATLYLNESVPLIGGPYSYNGGQQQLDGSGRNITIIDTGIDTTHPDFQGRVTVTRDFTGSGTIDDSVGHGTHVAGIAAGSGAASSSKFRGVAPGANLHIGKIADVFIGYGEGDIASAIEWAISQGTDVISLSLGFDELSNAGNCSGQGSGNIVYNAIADAIANNVVVVAAAGNGHGSTFGNISFPACIRDVIAVGASFKKDYNAFSASPIIKPVDSANATDISVTVLYSFDLSHPEAHSSYTQEWTTLPFKSSGFDYIIRYSICGGTCDYNNINVSMKAQHKYNDCSLVPAVWWDDLPGLTYYHFGFNDMLLEVAANPVYKSWSCANPDLKGYEVYTPPFTGNYFLTNQNIGLFAMGDNYGTPTLKGRPTFFSSRGPAPQNFSLTKPEVIAPGVDVCAPKATDTNIGDLNCGNDQYVSADGTSMAAPHVAGLVALLRQAYPSATVSEIRNAITGGVSSTITTIAVSGKNRPTGYITGYGLINEGNSISKICASAFADKNAQCAANSGFYCNGAIREYRNYAITCPVTSCNYQASMSQDCSKSYDSDGGLNYFKLGTCTDYNGCTPGGCTVSSQRTDYCGCGSSDPFSLSKLVKCQGKTQTDCSNDSDCAWGLVEFDSSGGSCGASVKNCKDLGSKYYCSSGICTDGSKFGSPGCQGTKCFRL